MEQPEPLIASAPSPRPTIVQYIGYSCFLIEAPDGTRVATDPYGCAVPHLPFPDNMRADLVTVSHGHDAHIQVHAIQGNPMILCGLTSKRVGMVRVTSYDTLHGECHGRYMGVNKVFVFQIGGAKIVHLGDLGRIESDQMYAAIEYADVVLAPVGELGTISCAQLTELLEKIGARTVVPHHFAINTGTGRQNMKTVAGYIATLPPGTTIVSAGELAVTPAMPKQVAVLSPKALAECPARDAALERAQPARSSQVALPEASPPASRIDTIGMGSPAQAGAGRHLDSRWQSRWLGLVRQRVNMPTATSGATWRRHPSRLEAIMISKRHKHRSH
jgi:L-ascorbate metabolism protein UlaG (beta-lactamase superfamily)